MKHYIQKHTQPIALKFSSLLFFVSLIMFSVGSEAASYYYTFDGTFTEFKSYNSYVTFQELGVVLGETHVSYTFKVDFDRDTNTLSSSYGIWNYFYSDLLGESVLAVKLNGIFPEENQSYNVYFPNQANLGQLVGGSFVRISARSSNTDNWRVENWRVGQQFFFEDGTVPNIGGYAVYLFGNATLTSITPIPDPSPPILICPEPLPLECTNGSAAGTVQVGVLDTNGYPVKVVWTVDGIAYQTNDIPSGGTITTSNVTFTANFGDGDHTVVVSASNGQTMAATCSTTVTVRDTLPPRVLAISATPNLLWPPNHRMVPISVTTSATDNCDSSPTAKIAQITCNEPLGRFAPDWQITGPFSVELRAERLGNSNRIYIIYVDFTDSSGNKTRATTTVTVPKSLSVLR